MPPLKLTHCFPSFRSLGGVEAVLRHHHADDARWDLASRFIIYHEPDQPPIERVSFLGLDSHSTIRDARRRLSTAFAAAPPDIAVWHGMWGLPFLADLDQAARRILVLHGETPGIEASLTSRREWLDGVACVSGPLVELVRRCAPALAAERVTRVPYPISPPAQFVPRVPLAGRPLVLGFCGRLVVEQKRVDRLPQMCASLDDAGLDYRLEFLGDGPERARLEAQFPNRAKFVFHGRRSGPDYWRVLGGWDAVFFASDYEGTPIALLEALSTGVAPVYPRIGSGGDAYAGGLGAEWLYEPGDFAGVAAALGRLHRLPEAEVEALRERCRQAARPHIGDGYLKTFTSFIREIRAAPRVAGNRFPWRPFPVDYLPFSVLEKMGTVRRWWRSTGA